MFLFHCYLEGNGPVFFGELAKTNSWKSNPNSSAVELPRHSLRSDERQLQRASLISRCPKNQDYLYITRSS